MMNETLSALAQKLTSVGVSNVTLLSSDRDAVQIAFNLKGRRHVVLGHTVADALNYCILKATHAPD